MANIPAVKNESNVNFVIMARFHSHIPVPALRDALIRLKGRQRAFDIGSPRDFHHPHPPETGPFPLKVLTNSTSDTWQEIAAKELAQPFPSSDPRVRFVKIDYKQASDLLIVCDHSVSDAISCILLINDLLELLNQPELKLAPLPVPPPIWEVLPSSGFYTIQNKLRMKLSIALLDLMEWNKTRQKIIQPALSFQVNSAELSSDVTHALRERCRLEHTSVHAAVCAAWLLSLDALDDDKNKSDAAEKKKRAPKRSVSSPVSIRKWLAPEMQRCAGLFYSIVQTNIRCYPSRRFWDMAREIKQKLTRAENEPSFHSTPLFFQTMYKRMSGLPENVPFHMPEPPVNYDFSITNLGLVENRLINFNQKDSPYTIQAIYGPMVNAFHGEKTVGVCTLGGQIRFVFTTFAEDINLANARELTHSVMKILEEAVQVHETSQKAKHG